MDRERLSRGRLFAYALPAVPMAGVGLPLAVHVPPLYAGSLGLGLSLVGGIFLLARLWDMVTDPVLGVLSDRVSSRWGRRRHWIVLSVPLILLSVAMVFMPPMGVSGAYLLFWLFVLYIGWTLLNISHMSWGAELTPDYHERSRIQGTREIANIIGMLSILTLPVLIEWTEPESLAAARVGIMGWFVLIMLPLAVYWAVTRVPERPSPPRVRIPMRHAIGALVENRPLRMVLGADLLTGIGSGLVASLFLFLTEEALGLGGASNLLLLCYLVSAVGFIPLVLFFARRFGKHATAAGSALFNALTVPLVLLVPVGNVPFALVIWVCLGVNQAAGPFLFRSMMADVSDHDEVTTRQQRTGLFYALLNSTHKIGFALAIGLGYLSLDLIGFDPAGDNSRATLDALRALFVWPLVLMSTLVALIFCFFPLDESAQRSNRAILDARGHQAFDGPAGHHAPKDASDPSATATVKPAEPAPPGSTVRS